MLYRALKIKQAEELQSTHDGSNACLTVRGCKPEFHPLDNKLSKEPQQLLEHAFGVTVEILLPNNQHRNST